MHLRSLAFLAIGVLCATFASFAPAEDEADEAFKKELEALAGTWRPVDAEVEGMLAPKERLMMLSMTRGADGKVVGREGDTIILEGTVKKIDASKKPKTIDTEITLGANKGKTIVGIYEIDGDTLRVCAALPGNERPTEFSAKEGSGHALTVYKREKK